MLYECIMTYRIVLCFIIGLSVNIPRRLSVKANIDLERNLAHELGVADHGRERYKTEEKFAEREVGFRRHHTNYERISVVFCVPV